MTKGEKIKYNFGSFQIATSDQRILFGEYTNRKLKQCNQRGLECNWGGAHTYTGKAGVGWSGEMQHPRSSECFYIELDREAGSLHTVRQGDGLLHIDTQGGRTVYIVGGTQAGNIQMDPGRELWWTFSA